MHGSTLDRTRIGRRARGLWVHVQPIFLLPGAVMSVFGALLATDPTIPIAVLHATAVCLAVYVAHLKDGYVDHYIRGEDETNPLEPSEIRVAIIAAAGLFAGCLGALWLAAGPIGALLTAPLLALGYLHAPVLDTNPATESVDYPLGIVLATAGGYATQTGTVTALALSVCLILFLLLVAINVMLDRLDYRHDRRVGKRTLPVVLGPDRALRVAWALVLVSVATLAVSSRFGPLPRSALLAGAVPVGAILSCRLREPDPERLVALFIGATYAFGLALFLTIRFS